MKRPTCPRCSQEMGLVFGAYGHPRQRLWLCPACHYLLDAALVKKGA